MCPLENTCDTLFQLNYVLTLRLLYTAENHCPAMSQRATIELRVLHAGLMYSTSLTGKRPYHYSFLLPLHNSLHCAVTCSLVKLVHGLKPGFLLGLICVNPQTEIRGQFDPEGLACTVFP